MKFRSLSVTAIIFVLLSACGINDLEKQVEDLENQLGTNTPIDVTFSTKDDNGNDVSESRTFSLNYGPDYNYMYVDGDDVEVYVYRIGDMDWDEYAGFQFYYNKSTKVTSDYWFGDFYGYDKKDWNDFEGYFCSQTRCGYNENTQTVKINKLDTKTGYVDVEITYNTTAASSNNQFGGKAMEMKLNFKGKIRLFVEQ